MRVQSSPGGAPGGGSWYVFISASHSAQRGSEATCRGEAAPEVEVVARVHHHGEAAAQRVDVHGAHPDAAQALLDLRPHRAVVGPVLLHRARVVLEVQGEDVPFHLDGRHPLPRPAEAVDAQLHHVADLQVDAAPA